MLEVQDAGLPLSVHIHSVLGCWRPGEASNQKLPPGPAKSIATEVVLRGTRVLVGVEAVLVLRFELAPPALPMVLVGLEAVVVLPFELAMPALPMVLVGMEAVVVLPLDHVTFPPNK